MKKKCSVTNFYNGIKDAEKRHSMMLHLKSQFAGDPERIAEIDELPKKWEYWAHFFSFMSEDERDDVLNLSDQRKSKIVQDAGITFEILEHLLSQLELADGIASGEIEAPK